MIAVLFRRVILAALRRAWAQGSRAWLVVAAIVWLLRRITGRRNVGRAS